MDYAIPWCVCSGKLFLFSLNLHLRVGFLGCSATGHPYPLDMTVENVNAHRTPGIFHRHATPGIKERRSQQPTPRLTSGTGSTVHR